MCTETHVGTIIELGTLSHHVMPACKIQRTESWQNNVSTKVQKDVWLSPTMSEQEQTTTSLNTQNSILLFVSPTLTLCHTGKFVQHKHASLAQGFFWGVMAASAFLRQSSTAFKQSSPALRSVSGILISVRCMTQGGTASSQVLRHSFAAAPPPQRMS